MSALLMSRWQHFLHIFRVHDWHYLQAFKAEVRFAKHGPHAPTESATMVKRVCCHCGEVEVRPVSTLSVSEYLRVPRSLLTEAQ